MRDTGVEKRSQLGLEPAEFAELYQTHSRPVYYLALRYLGDPQKAEDVTHDVFLKVYRKLNEFRGESSWRTWLYRITLNHCHNVRQRHSRNLITNADEAVLETPPRGPIRPCGRWRPRNSASESRKRSTDWRKNTGSCCCWSPTRS